MLFSCSSGCAFSCSLFSNSWRDSAVPQIVQMGYVETDCALEMFTKLQIFSLFLYLFSLVTFIFLSIWEEKNCFAILIIRIQSSCSMISTRNMVLEINQCQLIISMITLHVISTLYFFFALSSSFDFFKFAVFCFQHQKGYSEEQK